ncbi:MAG: hypothetical protein IH984_08005 [Planctomycetes bacterium]|nr:hypothetical protein [Planctomycetota bacterium]
MTRPKMPEPCAVSLGDVARRKLAYLGINPELVAWIAPAVLKLYDQTEGISHSTAQAESSLLQLEKLGEFWRQSKHDRDTGVCELLDIFAADHCLPPREEPTAEQTKAIKCLQSFVDTCRNHGVDFGAAFPRFLALRPPSSRDPYRVMWIAWQFSIANEISADNINLRMILLAFGDQPDWWDSLRNYGNRKDNAKYPTSLQLWLELQGARTAKHLMKGMSDMSLPYFLRRARGIAYVFSSWSWFKNQIHPESFAEAGNDFATICRHVFEEADRRAASFEVVPDELRHVWLRFGWMVVEETGEWMLPECRARLIRAAADEIGRLRPLLRRANDDDGEQLKQLDPHFRNCIFVLFKLGSLWQATKPLLLAFRAMNERAVGYDLRYWSTDMKDDPPTPWEMIPRSLMNMLHHYMGREQDNDPQLDKFRAEFALFCLERLKTRERRGKQSGSAESGQVEADPVWREGFIQAARALCVNPKGKGHHVLNWVSKNDPDDTVREVAMKAYAELRHQPSLPKGLSPRRAVFDAFWWLRQAHLTSLGEIIDHDGANHTREEEARRTTELTPK